jgi:hypothetical protein
MNSTPAPVSLFKRFLAFLIVIIFIGLAGAVIFYAKKTQIDAPQTATLTAPAETPVSPPAAASGDLPKPILAETPPPTAEPEIAPAADLAAPPAIENVAATPTPPSGDSVIFAEKITAMEQTINRIQQENTRLADALATLQNQAAQNQNHASQDAALFLAAYHLQNAFARNHEFASAVNLILPLAQNQPELLTALQPLVLVAERGLVPVADLQNAWAGLRRDILHRAARQNTASWAKNWAGEGIIADAIGQLGGLITIRRIDADTENLLDKDLAQIDSAVMQNAWAAIIPAAQNLASTYPSAELQSWLGAVRDYDTAQTALDAMQKILLRQLAAPQG